MRITQRITWITILLLSAFLPVGLFAEIVEKRVEFSASHPLHEVKGVAEQIVIKDLHTDGQILKGPFTMEIPYTSLNTHNRSRDSHMLEVLHYPRDQRILVEVQRMVSVDATHVVFEGFLTIASERRPVSIAAVVSSSGKRTIVDGTTTVSLKDYKIEAPSLLGIAMADSVAIQFHFAVEP